MSRASPLQSNFSSGEFSPLLYGRVETERYKYAVQTCKNYIPMLQGGLTRRPGSYFAAEVKDSSKKTRLVSFEFSITQAYIIEFGDLYVRFYRNNGQLLDGGPPYEVVTTYLEADLFQLKFTQSADVLYITHPDYPPRKLTRTTETSWTITTIDFLDGPYLPLNVTATTLTPSAFTGNGVTLTASAALFASTDVGRLIRLKEGTTWGWVKIVGYTSTTVVTVDIKSTLTSTAAKANWRLGVWSATTGYPSCATFHEDRLFFAGNSSNPQRLDGSRTGDYENFAPTDTDSVLTASHGLSFNLNSNDVNVVRWMISDEKGLLVGSVGGEWYVRAASASEALSPVNVNAKRSTSYGSANVQAVQVGKSAIFVQRAGRKVRDLGYFFEVDGFRSSDMTLLSEHITAGGITQICFQKEPQSIVWGVRTDGTLVGMTYERDLESLKAGWHRHTVGGYGDAAGGPAVVESVAVIPSPDGTRDELWMIVKRYINGTVKRYVEYVTQIFEDTVAQEDAFFVDCGLTNDNPLTIISATKANPVVIGSTAHGLANGDKVRISEVSGMVELNGNVYKVANQTANTFELQTTSGVNVDGTTFTTYVSGGEARKLVTTLSGLTHLEGQTVSILADGAVHPDRTVSGGAVTLAVASAVIHIGLGYESDIQLLRFDAGSQDGTSLGKTRRTNRMGLYLHRSLGLEIGMSFDELTPLTFRNASDDLSAAVPLYSGILSEVLDATYDFENNFCWRQGQPLPSTILAAMPHMVTQDRG